MASIPLPEPTPSNSQLKKAWTHNVAAGSCRLERIATTGMTKLEARMAIGATADQSGCAWCRSRGSALEIHTPRTMVLPMMETGA